MVRWVPNHGGENLPANLCLPTPPKAHGSFCPTPAWLLPGFCLEILRLARVRPFVTWQHNPVHTTKIVTQISDLPLLEICFIFFFLYFFFSSSLWMELFESVNHFSIFHNKSTCFNFATLSTSVSEVKTTSKYRSYNGTDRSTMRTEKHWSSISLKWGVNETPCCC